MATDRQESTPATVRIDVRRALKALLFTLVIPVSAAVLLDVTSGTMPVLTIAAAVICIPLATIVVNRTLLAEMDRIVAIVAPEEELAAPSDDRNASEPNHDGDRMVEAAM